ncbi:DNA helicase rad5 [Geranomyces variabilis]|uniref:DNA helicase rad5 n=1 Tax=Geranomyces variabilis TaxID=109894 RepID=A0AAD5TCK2_9FUNG|nr:DNA helicase rad5 [Geranomyces variabilis]
MPTQTVQATRAGVATTDALADLSAILAGTQLSSAALSALLAAANGDVETAVNLYFENPAAYSSPAIPLTDAAAPSPLLSSLSSHSMTAARPSFSATTDNANGKRKAADTVLPPLATAKRLKSQSSSGSGPSWHYVGDIVIVALSMVRGGGYAKDGDEIDTVQQSTNAAAISKQKPKGGRVGAKAAKAGPITRFSVRGKEIAKMNRDDAKILGKLVELGVIAIKGTVVSVPPSLTMLGDIILQLRIYLTPAAFMTISSSQDEETQDQTIKDRKLALLHMFQLLGLRPLDPALVAGLKDDPPVADVSPSAPAKAAGMDDEPEQAELEDDQVEILYEKARGFEDVPEAEPRAGLTVEMRGYQKQALAWMSAKENQTSDPNAHSIHPLWEEYAFPGCEPENAGHFYLNPYTGELTLNFPSAADQTRGGILADEMGLGKTLETLSLIHSNRPTAEDMARPSPRSALSGLRGMSNTSTVSGTTVPALPQTRATLIVCPVSLLAQWRDEITARFRPGTLTCAVYYSADRALSVADLTGKKGPDVVITTYGTVSSEWGGGTGEGGPGKRASLVFALDWFRVVLDEAHYIKNKGTANAKSCFTIQAKRRWAVTGTPIQNRLEDLFSLVHFLRIEPWGNYSFWRQFISVPFAAKDHKALNVVQSILEPLVLRRQKSTPSGPEGRPIVELPPKIVDKVLLDFTSEERDIYDALHTRSKTQFSNFVAAGSVLSNWAHVFQMLTRLRQCCLHPQLALGKGSTKTDATIGGSDVDALIRRFQDGVDGGGGSPAGASTGSGAGGESPYIESVFQKLNGTGDYGADGSSAPANGEEDQSCALCFDVMATPTIFPCLHISCRDCIVAYLQKREDMGEPAQCPICSKPFPRGTDDLYDIIRAPQPPPQTAPPLHGADAADIDSATQQQQQQQPRRPAFSVRRHFHPSTKLTALIAELTHLRTTAPDVKTVVFSQFTTMLTLCETILQEHGFGYARLDGTLSQREREAVLKRFASDSVDEASSSKKTDTSKSSKCTVLLASMRAAGVGLNLTRASVVICLDTWWNLPTEMQAIDRVHRLGQTRAVHVKRFIMRDSVEERMLDIQERKTVLCRWAIRDGEVTGEGGKAQGKEEEKRRRVEELKTLFG